MLAPVSMPPAWLDQDVASVRRAAGLLQIQEFAFFRLAYRHWHGRSAPDRDLEPLLISYLFRRRVPPWVRHLAREVQERSANAALLPQDYGLDIAPPPPPWSTTGAVSWLSSWRPAAAARSWPCSRSSVRDPTEDTLSTQASEMLAGTGPRGLEAQSPDCESCKSANSSLRAAFPWSPIILHKTL
jgi:hypothetical protein